MNWRSPDLGLYRDVDFQDLLKALMEGRVADFLEANMPAISPRANVREFVHRMMTERKLAYLVWRHEPHGIATYLDALLSFAAGKSAKATRVSEIVRDEGVYATSPDTPVLPLILWMTENSVPMVAVFKGGSLLGIFTAVTAFEHFVRLLRKGRERGTA